jgi:hypothetical protein
MRWMMVFGGVLVAGCSILCEAQSAVRITGRAHALGPAPGRVTTVLMNAERDTLDVERTRRGRFSFKAPAGQVYMVSFAMPCSVTKEVVVDTRHARRAVAKPKKRSVKFDVMMDAGDPDVRPRYLRPVGSVAFAESNGRLLVAHDLQMDPVMIDALAPAQD